MALRLLSVNVGRPRPIGLYQGREVLSGIAKAPVADAMVAVGPTNIAGDGQADLSVHGGLDKAVYCYPADHFGWWTAEHGLACGPATFGENLTVEGADETAIAIGDRFRWGEVVLEVSQPRAPCFKLAMHVARPDAPALMTGSGRCGWYFRVVKPGAAATVASRLVREARSGGPSVREAFFAALDARTGREVQARVRAAKGLSAAWQEALDKRLTG